MVHYHLNPGSRKVKGLTRYRRGAFKACLFLLFCGLEAALLCIGIKSPGNQAKEDRPKYRPKRGLIIMIQDWLQTGKDDTDRYDQPNDRRNPVGCSLRLKEHKWPIQVLDLLKEWEGPD